MRVRGRHLSDRLDSRELSIVCQVGKKAVSISQKSSLEEFRPSLYRDSAAGPAEWFGSNAASCTCSSLPSLKRIDKFHSLLIYSIHIGQHLHSFCFGNFRKVLPSLHSMKFSPMYLYLHNSLTHQYMFTILLPLIMGSILIISALYCGSLIQHGTAWTVFLHEMLLLI